MERKVLICEDEESLKTVMAEALVREGFEVFFEDRAEKIPGAVKELGPDVILLDIVLPGGSGLEACRALQADPALWRIPIIIVSGRDSEADKVLALELGAHDYVSKPFSVTELVARVKTAFRRSNLDRQGDDPEIFRNGSIALDPHRYRVVASGSEIQLTLSEFKLLQALISDIGNIKTRQELHASVLGSGVPLASRVIDVHMGALRKKLGSDGLLIETVRGIGYRMKRA